MYHYTDDPEVNTVPIHTVSIAIVVAIWLIVTALLLSFAVVMERSLRYQTVQSDPSWRIELQMELFGWTFIHVHMDCRLIPWHAEKF